MLKDRNIDNILISSMVSSGEKTFKYIIGYKDNDHRIKPLSVMLPKWAIMYAYIKNELDWEPIHKLLLFFLTPKISFRFSY